jgi:hypothetical protein
MHVRQKPSHPAGFKTHLESALAVDESSQYSSQKYPDELAVKMKPLLQV